MNADDSIFLKELTRRMNECLSQGQAVGDIDTVEIENEIISDANLTPDELRSAIERQASRTKISRSRTKGRVRREIAERWGRPLDLLGRCIDIADLINDRLVRAVFMNGDVLRGKNPRPMPDRVTGAYVKCLHSLSLYSKSCIIAAEILCLLREGFPDAAASRFRTLHEHLVIAMVLLNDRTYELSEAYEESAVFEYLKQLRVDLSSFSDPALYWTISNELAEERSREISEEILDTEALANEIVGKRGAKFRDQYEWARPKLPEPKRSNLQYRMNFTDLEQIAGMDFLRRNYLMGNDRVHAGAYAVINHFDFENPKISPIRQRQSDSTLYFVGFGVSQLLGWAARCACKSIAYETEEYDEFIYASEIYVAANAAMGAFNEAISPSPEDPDD